MKKKWKIELRNKCKTCGLPIVKKRFRTYCSQKCRTKFYNQKFAEQHLEWFRKKRAEYKPGKIQCVICGGWYVQICSHAYLRHKMTGREYKKYIGKDVKRGYIPEWYRDIKHELNQATWEKIKTNLKKGKKYWFKKGDPRVGNYERSPETMARLHRGTMNLNN